MAKSTIVAVCGKGGVGKTSISALIVKLLTQGKKRKILAIDADPALGLATALGIAVKKRESRINVVSRDVLLRGRTCLLSEAKAQREVTRPLFRRLPKQEGMRAIFQQFRLS